MKSIFKIILIVIIIIVSSDAKQTYAVVPDSLLGSYSGIRLVKDVFVCDTCWISSMDTLVVKEIDTSLCYASVFGNIIPITSNYVFTLVTDYNICNDSVQNWFFDWARFYNNDSVEMYFYEFSRPPDLGYHPYGFHFWGKRISSKFLSAPEVKAVSRLVNIAFVGEEIIIETNNSETGNLQLMDLSGRVLHQSKIWSTRTVICAPSTGVLIYRFVNSKGEVQSGKIAVN